MSTGGSRNSLYRQDHAAAGPPADAGVIARSPRRLAVVRRNHTRHGLNGRAATGRPAFLGSEPDGRTKRASNDRHERPAATGSHDDPRLAALRRIALRMKKMSWTPALFALLLDELYVDDLFTPTRRRRCRGRHRSRGGTTAAPCCRPGAATRPARGGCSASG